MPDQNEVVANEKIKALEEQLKAKTEGLQNKIQTEADGLQEEGKEIEELADRPIVEIDIDVAMKLQTWRFHLPQVAMREQTWRLDLPQVAMRRQEWIFHTPSVRMERKKTGEYPEFYCDTSTLIPKCTVKWSPIYTDVPVPFMQEQRISLDVPEFTWDSTEMKLHVPEFTWEETEMKLHVPEFTVNAIRFNWPIDIADEAKARGDALTEKAKDLEARSVAESKKLEKEFRFQAVAIITDSLNEEFGKTEAQLESERTSAMKKFADSLAMIKSLEESVTGKENDEFRKQLAENRKSLIESQEKARVQFEEALAKLIEQKKVAINKAVEQQGLTPEGA